MARKPTTPQPPADAAPEADPRRVSLLLRLMGRWPTDELQRIADREDSAAPKPGAALPPLWPNPGYSCELRSVSILAEQIAARGGVPEDARDAALCIRDMSDRVYDQALDLDEFVRAQGEREKAAPRPAQGDPSAPVGGSTPDPEDRALFLTTGAVFWVRRDAEAISPELAPYRGQRGVFEFVRGMATPYGHFADGKRVPVPLRFVCGREGG